MSDKPKRKILSLRNPATRRTLLTGFAFIAGFVVFAIIGIQVWEWSNSPEFCTNVCHDVHPEETMAYEDSYHARVKCVECHMGRVSTLRNMALKASHFKHLPATIFGQYEHPLTAETFRPANESCERCHWPPSFHYDTVLEITHFEPDEQNTERRIYLILKTGGGDPERGMGVGIHWHIQNQVEFIASDERLQDIQWVRVTNSDGTVVEYSDITDPLAPDEIVEEEIHVMDCVDCHNQMGHPFYSPEHLVDIAIEEGRLSQDLPFAKRDMTALLSAEYHSQEEAFEAIEAFRHEYEAAYPDIAAAYTDEIDQAVETAQELITRLVFEEPGVTWRSFPNQNGHGGHTDFPGCFRCHDGNHLNEDGESIRLHCNICHSIPAILYPGEQPPLVPIVSAIEPEFHRETNFMADHRFQANGECVPCHGEIEFGSDDSSFCANSACHGQAWPAVNLDAAFPHPIELEGQHAEVWCHDCHEGVREPEYVCSNCHEPPMEPHFGAVCEDCHTPEDWADADPDGFIHPVALQGTHATLTCSDCHTAGQRLTYDCAECHEPPSAEHFGPNCEDCHSPTTTFADAVIAPELHPVPLIGAHLRATCNVCHQEGAETPEYVCANCHLPPQNHLPGDCDDCHTPEGWVESADFIVAVSPLIPHTLEDREDCLSCHAPSSQVRPARAATHSNRTNDQCFLCHK